MEQVRLGATGLKVSRLCLGCMSYGSPNWRPWVLDEAASRPFFRRAIELGITFFDTADMYSLGRSEELTGQFLKEFARRDELVIATKVFHQMSDAPNDRGLSRKHILDSIDRSLKRLGTDHVDLYQIHRFDPETPLEETLEALSDVVRAGKARYLGASSMHAWQFMKMLALQRQHGWARFVSMQPHYNLVYREEEREMLPLCRSEGIGVIPWSPLARGFLAGGRRTEAGTKGGDTTRAKTDDIAQNYYYGPQDFEIQARLEAIATRIGRSPAQVALAWVMANPAITGPIIGATRLPQLEELVAAVGLELSAEDRAVLEEPYLPKPVTGHR